MNRMEPGDDDPIGRDPGDTEPSPAVPALPATVPQRIGAYRILRQIGEGGMGIVCEAQQDEPQRRVAVKLLKRSLDIENAAARLLVEREVLSMLQHENVARIHDAGIHGAGAERQPFFVMELIEGRSIVKYCDERGLPLAKRLELMIQVCSGLHHAHSRGVIHRDVSANNILVLDGDTGPVAKLIDFGIAKTLWQPKVAQAPITMAGTLPVTPEYMSPELASGDLQRVGVQSDVFSLGVLLYELVTTTLPFGGRRMRDASPAAREHILTHENPQRPSQRVAQVLRESKLDAVRPTCTAREVRRDLDWIIAKALSVDLRGRYASAAALADDLQRFLASRPVTAGPDSWSYRLRKWYRREPRYVAAVFALATVVVVTTGMLLVSHFDLQEKHEKYQGLYAESARGNEQLRASRDQVGHLRLENDVLRRDVYSNQVTRAEGLLSRGEIYWAKQELANTRAELRGWEWLFLQGMVDASVTTLGTNEAGFTAVAHSAVLGVVLAGSADGSVWAWDARTHEFRYSIRRHTAEVVDLAFDEPAGMAVSLSADGTCWRWNAHGESLRAGDRTAVCPAEDASRLFSRYQRVPERVGALSDDGKRVCWVGTAPARVVDVRTGTSAELRGAVGLDLRLEQNDKQGLWAMWIGSGPAIAFGRDDGTPQNEPSSPSVEPRATDLREGGVLFWSEQLEELVDRRLALLQMSPRSRIVMAGTDLGVCTRANQVYRFRAVSDALAGVRPAELTRLEKYVEEVCSLAISDDRKTIATCGGGDLRIMLWSAADGSFLGDQPEYPTTGGRLVGHDDVVSRVRFVGDRLLTSSFDGTVRWWDSRASGAVRRDARPSPTPAEDAGIDSVVRVAFSRDSRRTIAGTTLTKNKVQSAAVVVTEVANGVSSPPLGDPHWSAVMALGPSDVGERFEVVVRSGSEATTADCVVAVDVPRGSLASRPLLSRVDGDHEDVTWVFGSSGKVLATNVRADDAWQVAIWRRGDDGGWSQTHTFGETMPHVADLRFSDDESVLVAIGKRRDDGDVFCWDVAERSLRWRQSLSLRKVRCSAFSPDGNVLYVGTGNQAVFAMSVRTQGEWLELPLEDTAVNALALSSDGRRLLTGSEGAWARVYAIEAARGTRWEVSAQLLVSLPETGGYIPDVAWSADGSYLAIAGAEDACLRVYRGAESAAANARVLVDGLMQNRVKVTATTELARRTDVQVQDAMASRDAAQARTIREFAKRLLDRLADDPEHLDQLAWVALGQAGSSPERVSPKTPTKEATSLPLRKSDLLAQAQRLAETSIQLRPQWKYRRTLAIALMRRGDFDRCVAVLKEAEKEAEAEGGEAAKVGIRLLGSLVKVRAAAPEARGDALEQLKDDCEAASGGLDDVFHEILKEAKALTAHFETR